MPPGSRRRPRELPAITFAADGCVIAHWHGIGIVVWGTQATLELVAQVEQLSKAVSSHYERGSNINLVLEGTPPPTPEARAALKAMVDRFPDKIICAATLIEGTGFWVSAIRSLVTRLELVSRRAIKLKTFAEIDALAAWVAPLHAAELGVRVEPEELATVLRWLIDQPAIRDRRS